ncbi:hypothetical protein GCM10007881_30870 [Mesorhizobium huakuii]|nr:hypothetical protein GCM10007881_30870 [Mesorhizobium huakuii]
MIHSRAFSSSRASAAVVRLLGEGATHFLREVTIGSHYLPEIVTLEPESKVTFFQTAGPREGGIVNELFEDEEGARQLRFCCYMSLRGREPTPFEEQAQLNGENGYMAALMATLKRTRELLADGTL